MFCKNCGKELKDGVEFCSECGTEATAAKTSGTGKTPQTSPPQDNNSPTSGITFKTVREFIEFAVIVLIAIIFHDTIGDLWSERSGLIKFFLDLWCFLGIFVFILIPGGIVQLILSIVGNAKISHILLDIWHIIKCPIATVMCFAAFGNTKLEVVFFIIMTIVKAIFDFIGFIVGYNKPESVKSVK